MPLTGLDIYKLLPKTNCGKCGSPTCLAFAMKLAQKKATLEQCPDVSEETKQTLALASEPPIRTVTIGSGESKIEVGGETVMFRHEKTFYHPCGLGFLCTDKLTVPELESKLGLYNKLEFERVGQKVRPEFIAIQNESQQLIPFQNTVMKVSEITKAVLILMSDNPDILKETLPKVKDKKPIIYAANADNLSIMTELAKQYDVPLVIKANNLTDLATLSQKIVSLGKRDIILSPERNELSLLMEDLVQIRRLSIRKNFRPLGYPVLTFITPADQYLSTARATMCITKYSSIVILPDLTDWQQLALVTLRQNIYTDPQKPVSVTPKLYSIGGTPTDKSPVLVTTNFSLTYFTVEPEIINAKVPVWLLVCDSEGMSVLTAWAAEKFTAETVATAIKKMDLETTVSHRKLVIPGYVAIMAGKLNELSGWQVLVGPREAAGIPKFLRTSWSV